MTNTASKAFAIMTHRRTESEKTRTTHTKLIGRHFLFYFIFFFIFVLHMPKKHAKTGV